mgnify:CR=1 FL=1
MKGINRGNPLKYITKAINFINEGKEDNSKCIFISQQEEDTEACEAIAK